MPKVVLNEMLTALLAYWRLKCAGRSMPARRDISPADIPKCLPHVMLLDMPDGRLRYRLVGDEIVRAYGTNMTGKLLEQIVPPDRFAIASQSYAAVLETGRPLVSRSTFVTAKGVELDVTRLVLPLSDDGTTVTMILAGLDMPYKHQQIEPPLGIDTMIDAKKFGYEFL